jgi:hypothetical protein
MQSREGHGIEREPRRKCGHGADAVASGARPLRVATRAEIARARCSHAVLSYPVAIVNEMVGRWRAVVLEIDVAGVAVSHVPLVLMLVTAEAGRHLGAQLDRRLFGDPDVAAHAVSLHVDHVASVLEPQVLAGKLGTLTHEGLSVAGAARALVVRLGVAAATGSVCGEVDGARVAREGDAFVANDAVDPFDDVRAVLEWMGLGRLSEAQHAGACGERESEDQEQSSREHRGGDAALHRNSRVLESRRSALVS